MKIASSHLLVKPRIVLRRPCLGVAATRCCGASTGATPPSSPQPQPRPPHHLFIFRRAGLALLTAFIATNTPAPALASSFSLGVVASLISTLPRLLSLPSSFAMTNRPSPLLRNSHNLSKGSTAGVGVAVYVVAGLFEIGGGWLVWQAVRCRKPWWWALLGSIILAGYGFVATLQPVADFGRAYAVYGGTNASICAERRTAECADGFSTSGYFVILSIVWGAVLDGFRPDKGDYVGCALILAGVAVMTGWQR